MFVILSVRLRFKGKIPIRGIEREGIDASTDVESIVGSKGKSQ